MKKSIIIIAVVAILIINLLLGTRMVFSGDFFYLADQARDMLLVQNIILNKDLTLIGTHSGLGGFFHGPLWLYQLIPYYLLGHGDPFIFTYAYVSLALITVLVGYFVGTSLYGQKAGLLMALLLAVSPSIWKYVPNTIGVNMLPLIFLPLFYFLIRYLRGEQKAYIVAIFFAGLSLQYETALPLILIPVVLLSFFLNTKAARNTKVILLSLLSLIVSLSTFILFDLKHQFLQTHALLSAFTSGTHEKGYLAFPERIISHAKSFVGVYESILINQSIVLIILFAAVIIGFLVYVYQHKLYMKNEWKEFLYLLLFPVIIFICYLRFGQPVYPEYLLGLTIPVALAFIIASAFLLKEVWGKVLLLFFFGATLLSAGKLIYQEYLQPYQMNMTEGSYLQQKLVSEWLITDSQGKEFGYYVYSQNTFTYGMDYLLWWQTSSHGLAKPKSEKLPITYLILYPASATDKKAHAFWKKTKIRTQAKVIERKQFASGIIVEKLAIEKGEPEADPTYQQGLIFR